MEAEININFRKAFELVINGYEGKYSNDKDDPGGETYKGIARNKNKDFEGWGIIAVFVTLDEDEMPVQHSITFANEE